MVRKFGLCLFVGLICWTWTAMAQSNMSAFCQRFPTNANCRGSGSSNSASSSFNTGGARPVDPNSVGLPPPPTNGNGSPQQPQPGSSGNQCADWKSVYDSYCTRQNIDPQYQGSCNQYKQFCLSGNGGQGNGPVNPDAVGLPPPPSQGSGGLQPQPQPQPQSQWQPQPQVQPQPQGQQSGASSTWNALTQKAQADQAQQALINAQNGAANCGQFQENYNVWCGAQPINPTYCNTLGRICLQQQTDSAAGRSNFGGPFAGSGGLPTGGAGSTRPLSVGQNFGVGPFFGMGKNTAVNPLQGFGQRQDFNVPIAGIGVQSSKGVDWGGLPGVSQLGALLGGRRKRWAIPIATDQFGNIIYMIH